MTVQLQNRRRTCQPGTPSDDIQLDEEFRALIPPLTPDELAGLQRRLDAHERTLATLTSRLDERARLFHEAVPDMLARQDEALKSSEATLARAAQRLERSRAALARARTVIEREEAAIKREAADAYRGMLSLENDQGEAT